MDKSRKWGNHKVFEGNHKQKSLNRINCKFMRIIAKKSENLEPDCKKVLIVKEFEPNLKSLILVKNIFK